MSAPWQLGQEHGKNKMSFERNTWILKKIILFDVESNK